MSELPNPSSASPDLLKFDTSNISKELIKSATYQLFTDISIASFLLPIFLSFVNNDVNHIDSIVLISTYNNMITLASTSLLFTIKIKVSQLYPIYKLSIDSSSQEQLDIREKMIDMFRNGSVVSMITIPTAVLSYVFSGFILSDIFQQPNPAATYAQNFLRLYSVNMPAIIYSNCCRQMIYGFREQTAQKIGFYFVAFGVVIAGLLARYEVIGNGGIVLGYAVSQYGSTFVYAYYIFFHSRYQSLGLLKSLFMWPNYTLLKAQLYDALPLFVINMTEATFLFILSLMSGFIDADSQAAMTLVLQYVSVNFWIGTNFAMAAVFLMNLSREDKVNKHLVFPTALTGIIITSCASSIVPIFFACYPESLTILFGVDSDSNILNILKVIAPIMSIGSICDTSYYAPMFHIRAVGDVKGVLWTHIPSIFIGVTMVTVLVLVYKKGVDAIAYSYLTTMVLSVSLVVLRWMYTMRPFIESYWKYRKELTLDPSLNITNASDNPIQSIKSTTSSLLSIMEPLLQQNTNNDSSNGSRFDSDSIQSGYQEIQNSAFINHTHVLVVHTDSSSSSSSSLVSRNYYLERALMSDS